MNEKTAKLLRKASLRGAFGNQTTKQAKRTWNKCPKNLRWKLRGMLEGIVEKA